MSFRVPELHTREEKREEGDALGDFLACSFSCLHEMKESWLEMLTSISLLVSGMLRRYVTC